MKRRDLILNAALAGAIGPVTLGAHAAPPANRPLDHRALSKAQGQALLDREDDFVQRLSGTGRSWRMRVDYVPSTTEYLRFVRANVTEWPATEAARLDGVIAELRPVFAALNVHFPWPVQFIRTTVEQEGAPYTRLNAVMLPSDFFEAPDDYFKFIVAHELWHVYSRTFATTRQEAYALIQYRPLACEVRLPGVNHKRRQTNPDAPILRYAIGLRQTRGGNAEFDAAPFEVFPADVFDGGDPPHFLRGLPKFLVIGGDLPRNTVLDQAWVFDNTNFLSLMTKNTDFLIYPEETMADNFAMLATNSRNPDAGQEGERLFKQLRRVLRRGPRA